MRVLAAEDRIRLATFTTGAHQPFLLDDPARAFRVEQGHLDLFAVELVRGAPVSRRLFVTRVPAGSMCFGVRPVAVAGESASARAFGFLAVPSSGAVLAEVVRSGLASVENLDLDTTIRIDEWVLGLSEFVARGGGPPPPGARLVEADPDVPYPAGSVLSAYPSTVVWVSADRPMRFIGRDDLALARRREPAPEREPVPPSGPAPKGDPGPERGLVPLSSWTWIELDTDGTVSAALTPAATITGQVWPALDRFGEMVLRYASLTREEDVRRAGEHHRAARRVRRATEAATLRELRSVLGAASVREAATGADARTPLEAAVGIVAESIGATVEIPRRTEVEDGDLPRAVEALVRRSGIRTRRIELAPGWWRRDGPSFVATTTGGAGTAGGGVEYGGGAAEYSGGAVKYDGVTERAAAEHTGGGQDRAPRVLAVLSNGRGGYRAVDPAAGRTFDVGAREAAEIGRLGVKLYAPLPDAVRTGTDALLHVLQGQGRDIRTLLVMATLGGLAALATPILTGRLLADVIPRVDVPMWGAFLGALLLATLGATAFAVVQAIAMLRIETRMDEGLQASVWSRLLSLPPRFFRSFTAGDLADRANGMAQVRQLVSGATLSAFIGGVFSVFSYALLFYYSWRLALCAGALLLVLAGATWVSARAQMRHLRTAFAAQGAIDGFVFQMITGLAKIRMANAENDALARWAARYSEQKRATLAARRWEAGLLSFSGTFAPLATLVIFAFIFQSLLGKQQQPDFGLAAFLSFYAAFGQLTAAMIALTEAWTTVVGALPLFERVQPILEAQPETVKDGADPGDLTGRIEFANVSFRYLPEEANALDRASFRIRPGEYVAFVGPSGSGKSTIYRLLLGFERPDSGAVFLDDHDLSSLDLPAVRSRMGVVLQDGRLSAASIFRNIAGPAPITLDDAWEAARAVGLDADVRAMPMGMHTIVPEGGRGLSGGQKQRLLMARALARRPRILLFDEATSALDNRTQAIVQASLKKLGVTRVVIAHRLSTVREADRILVMEEGRIVERGRYDELMAADGAFAALARRQMI